MERAGWSWISDSQLWLKKFIEVEACLVSKWMFGTPVISLNAVLQTMEAMCTKLKAQLYFAIYSNKAKYLRSLVISTAHQFGCADRNCAGQNKVYYLRIKNQMKTV